MKKIILFISIGLLSLQAEGITLPNSFKADFINIVTSPKKKIQKSANKKTQKPAKKKAQQLISTGSVMFSNGSLLKWIYLKPLKKEVCTNGSELLIVNHEFEQASKYIITKKFDLVKILKNAQLYKDKKNIYTSKYEDKLVTIKVDDKKQLHSVAYIDEYDNKVQIIFEKVKYDKKNISPKEMACSIPKDYDIINKSNK